jgi:hypothetical protein
MDSRDSLGPSVPVQTGGAGGGLRGGLPDGKLGVSAPGARRTPGPSAPLRAPERARAARLENTPNNSSAPASGERRRRRKWGLLDYLRTASTVERQRWCMARPVGPAVLLTTNSEGRAGYAGAMTCGQRTCPNCGPRIQAARREDIAGAVASARRQGLVVLFGTLTLGHAKSDPLARLLDLQRECWSAVTSGRAWHEDRARFGVVGYVWVAETKLGDNGWHPHRHFLLFVRPAPADGGSSTNDVLDGRNGEAMGESAGAGVGAAGARSDAGTLSRRLIARWRAAAAKRGATASPRAQDLHEATDGDVDTFAEYFTKEGAEDLALEMTGQDTKTGGGSLTPLEILDAAAGGQPWFRQRWAEYERAQQGRRQIGWSRGMRDQLELEDELDDEAAADRPEVATPVLLLGSAAFRRLARLKGGRGGLIAEAEAGVDVGGLIDWLALRGIAATLPRGGPPDGA